MLGMAPNLFALAVSAVTTVLVSIVGWFVFRRIEPSFADVV